MMTLRPRGVRPLVAAAWTAFTLACASSICGADMVPEQPNVIFIMADDLGYGELGCYGQQTIRTPRLDQMAAEGMRFTQFYAGNTVCAPSRSVLMTGQHMGHTHVRGNAGQDMQRQSLRDQDTTVAEVLREAGYTNALVGKWGLGEVDLEGHPLRQGFDMFYGYPTTTIRNTYGGIWKRSRYGTSCNVLKNGAATADSSVARRRSGWIIRMICLPAKHLTSCGRIKKTPSSYISH